MTITDVKLVSETGSRDLNGGPKYERKYHVYFTAGYSVAALLNNTEAALEKPGDEHPEDASVIAVSISPELHEDSAPDEGIAVYSVSFAVRTSQYEAMATNPLDRVPVVSGEGGVDINEAAHFDDDGKGILNSADDFYDPLPERPKRGASYNIVKNQATHPGEMAGDYSNTVNSDAFHGKPAGSCKIGKITWGQKSEAFNGITVTYYEVVIPIAYCPDGWRFKLVDNGCRKKEDDGSGEGAIVHIIDPYGNPVSSPVRLDGAGGELADDDPREYVIFPEAGYKVYHETAWAALSLPNPFSAT